MVCRFWNSFCEICALLSASSGRARASLPWQCSHSPLESAQILPSSASFMPRCFPLCPFQIPNSSSWCGPIGPTDIATRFLLPTTWNGSARTPSFRTWLPGVAELSASRTMTTVQKRCKPESQRRDSSSCKESAFLSEETFCPKKARWATNIA